ncbi:hypothetical protein ES703_81212 [subsurface metagenome]
MAIDIPGLSLSVLRQQTSVRAGLPLLISGRFTAFGMGVPTFIRVFLEGPSYDPQLRSFDTFASPFSGDYAVNVLAEKDGRYNVYAQAFPPPLIPSGPPFPEARMLLPPIAESTHPPLVVGLPFNGGVDALLPDGTRERLTAPEMLDIEITPIITIGAPVISFPPGAPTMVPYAPPLPPGRIPPPPYVPPPPPPAPPPAPPEIPEPPPPPVPPPVVPEVPVRDILGTPSLNLPRQLDIGEVWTGSVNLPTYGLSPVFAEAHLMLRDPQGKEIAVSRPGGITLQPRDTLQIPVNFDTTGFSEGNYTILLRVFDQFGQQVAEFPMGFLTMILALLPPIPTPPVPAPPEIPQAPAFPTADMFRSFLTDLPAQVEIGEIWAGEVSIATGTPIELITLPSLPAYVADIKLELEGLGVPTYSVGSFRRTFTPGEDITFPVNFDTSVLTQEGFYNLLLTINDYTGKPIMSTNIWGLTALMPALPPPPAPPPVPEPPEIPTPPTPPEIPTPPPTLPRADIKNFDIILTSGSSYDPGSPASVIAQGMYKGRGQGGALTLELGTGMIGTFFSKFTLPSIPVNFDESYDWESFSFRASFTIPAGVELGRKYHLRATIQAFTDPAEESEADWNVIEIRAPAAPPPPPPAPPVKTGFVVSMMSGYFPTATSWYADFNGRYFAWFLPVTGLWEANYDLGPSGESGTLTVELYDTDLKKVKQCVVPATLQNGHAYEFNPSTCRLTDIGTF